MPRHFIAGKMEYKTKPGIDSRTGKETWSSRNAFETYMMMGPSRTVNGLAQLCNVSLVTLKNWKKEFGWDRRLISRDNKMISEIEKENELAYKEAVRIRHQEAYKTVQDKSLVMIDGLATKGKFAARNLKDASMALDLSINGERKALGMEGAKIRGLAVKEGVATLVEAIFSQ